MLQSFNKRTLVLFVLLSILSSCDKDDKIEPIEERTPIVITGSDYKKYQKVDSKTISLSLDNSKITLPPIEGEDQIWDLKIYEVSNPARLTSRDNLLVPSGTSFTSADFIRTQSSTFISAFTYNEFYEISEEGYYTIGSKINVATADLGNGTTLTTLGIEAPYNPKGLIFKFPMNYGDVTEQEGMLSENYSLTAPAFGLSNASVERKITIPTKSEVVGWGKLLLPQEGIMDSTEVLLVKNTITNTLNYFLNESTAPKSLLDALNLIEGSSSTFIYYYFVSKEFGTIASSVFAVDSNGTTLFPAISASYATSKQ